MCVGSSSECLQHLLANTAGYAIIFPAIFARGARLMSYSTDSLVLCTRIWSDLLVQKDAIFILAG